MAQDMTQEELQGYIIDSLQVLGGRNVPINLLADKVKAMLSLQGVVVDTEVIKEIAVDMCQNHLDIHPGMSDSKGTITVSLDTKTPVKMPPNQNPHMKK
ncbi:MAG: hypothetical protein Q4D33_13130 [Prevotellaceae bacterium]|nr:hypothetical protein [Prevotellaceae bacterium]